ncbi:GNAT family N-acetyltransferase [Sphingomicrobium sp. XHP0239]|uniref:GNAT family N-acetyltransferase n=1 Tax=Sphingomicrobium maritimum TaxID=3133972 RepID=UPI0031CC8717
MGERSIHHGELQHDDVRELLAQHFTEMRAGSPPSACHVMTADALVRDDILFLSLRGDDGELLGVGALRTLDATLGEIKSMRVADGARGTGAGRAMLDAIVAEARTNGMTRLSLETGTGALFEPANRLYRAAGIERCGPFGGYRASDFTLFYTRAI